MGVKRKTTKQALQKILVGLAATVLLIGALAGCSSGKSDSTASNSGGAARAAVSPAAPAAASDAKSSATATAEKAAANNAAAKTESPKQADQAGAQNQSPTAQTGAQSQSPAAQAGITPPIAADSGDGFNRKLIYKANLVMEVPSYGEAQTKLRDLAALSGAFILQFTETTNEHEKSGNYTIKVAAKGFASFLDGLEKISPSMQRSVQGQDVTEEYVDLDARLKAKQAVEARLLAFMDKAQKTEDLVAFSNELSKVQTEIEQIKGRMRYLDQNVSLSTIELRMYEKLSNSPTVKKPGALSFSERIDNALNGSLNVLGTIAQGLVVFLAGALPVLFLFAMIFAVYWIVRKQRMQKLQQVRSELKKGHTAVTRQDSGTDDDAKE